MWLPGGAAAFPRCSSILMITLCVAGKINMAKVAMFDLRSAETAHVRMGWIGMDSLPERPKGIAAQSRPASGQFI